MRRERAGERKQFSAQHPDGRGGWLNGLDKSAPRVLYRLPDILAANRSSIVYLTEGERKADKLADWGFVATAIAFGAKGWRDSYLTGAGSTGKSLLSQQLATCIALGRPFLGVETRQSVAIYLTCEDDVDELHRRQMAICAALGVSPRDLSGRLHLVSLAGAIGNELVTFDPQGRMLTTEAWATLRATVMQTGAGLADWPYNTAAWKRLRLAHLSLSPMCVGCKAMGMVTPANTVDHITAISDGGPPFPGHDGLASYCPACHGAKTARGNEAGAVRTRKPRRGCNADGTPLDPAHPWHGKSLKADRRGPMEDKNTQLVGDLGGMGKRGPGAGKLRAAASLAPMEQAGWGGTMFETLEPARPLMATGRIQLDQSKTNNAVDVPVVEPLRAALDAGPLGREMLLETKDGAPFTPKGFYGMLKKACVAAGIPHCAPHGLRKSAARRCREAGCSDDEGMATPATRAFASTAGTPERTPEATARTLQ